ncbi:SIMPL domain-containing protein [Neisseria montereyensis]|uniref:SIMPL domain-containing protein n=1 Tax=Neisseria montereyensis TaxID=2973938 RepID=A0ABT2FEX4_9NEIS|nr:SIMPL domain-containing protein [Neisseria montereyensis]MCS4534748.1 SIMPL domain-containing protein [Neisseria montereyensis]
MFKPIALVTLLLTASIPTYAETLNYNVVEFSESAGIEVVRDTASARLRVHEEGVNREAVSANFIKKLDSVTRKATASPFKTELISRSASPRYEFSDKGNRTQTGWEEEALLQVESQNFEAINQLIADTQQDANLESLVFSVSKQNRQDAVDEVSRSALRRFKDRAAALTKEMGFRSYKIVHLDFGQIGNRTVNNGMAMMRAAPAGAMASPSVPEQTVPGTEEVSVTVHGTIQM